MLSQTNESRGQGNPQSHHHLSNGSALEGLVYGLSRLTSLTSGVTSGLRNSESSTVDGRRRLGHQWLLVCGTGSGGGTVAARVRESSGTSTGNNGTRCVGSVGGGVGSGGLTGLANTLSSSSRNVRSNVGRSGSVVLVVVVSSGSTDTGKASSTSSGTSSCTSTARGVGTLTGVVGRRTEVLGLGRSSVAGVLLARLDDRESGRVPVLVDVAGRSLGSGIALVDLLDPTIGVTEVGEDRVAFRGGQLEGTVALLLGVVVVLGEGLLESVSDTLALDRLVALNAVTELDELTVKVLETVTDTLLSSPGDLLLDDTGSKGTEDLDEGVVLAVADSELELVDLGNHLLDGEDVAALLASRGVLGLEVDGDGQALTTEEDVGSTALVELGETKLLLEEEVDIAHVGLDLVERELERVLVTVTKLVKLRELEVVSDVHLDLRGQHVEQIDGKVLDDQVDLLVGVLDTGKGHETDVAEQLWKDRVTDVAPEVGLEGQVALRVEEEVLGDLGDVVTELAVERVAVHRLGKVRDLPEESILVGDVLALRSAIGGNEELLAGLGELTSLRVGIVLHDVTGLLETLADVGVEATEPVLELGVVVGIGVELVNGINDGLSGSTVGEALDKTTESGLGSGNVALGTNVLGAVGGLVGDVGGVALVLLEEVEEVVHSILVVLVTLALNYDLLEAVIELVATLLRELLLQVVGSLVLVLLGEILVLLGDLVREQLSLLLSDVGDSSLVLLLAGVGVDSVGDVLGVGGTLLLGLFGLVLSIGLGLLLLLEKVGDVIVELVVGSGLVDAVELLLIRASDLGSLGGTVSEHVAADVTKVLDDLAKLTVAKEEGEKGAESLTGGLTVLLGALA